MGQHAGVDVADLDLPGLEVLRGADGTVLLPELVGLLAGLDRSGLPSDHDVLDLVAAWDRVANAAAAQRLSAVAELAARPEVFGPDDDPQVRPGGRSGPRRDAAPGLGWVTRWRPGWWSRR